MKNQAGRWTSAPASPWMPNYHTVGSGAFRMATSCRVFCSLIATAPTVIDLGGLEGKKQPWKGTCPARAMACKWKEERNLSRRLWGLECPFVALQAAVPPFSTMLAMPMHSLWCFLPLSVAAYSPAHTFIAVSLDCTCSWWASRAQTIHLLWWQKEASLCLELHSNLYCEGYAAPSIPHTWKSHMR